MASVSVWCQFADGDQVAVRIDVATSYPDALSEARAEALVAFKGAVRDLLEAEGA